MLRIGGTVIIASGDGPGSAVLKAIVRMLQVQGPDWSSGGVALRQGVVHRRKAPAEASALKRSSHWGTRRQ